MRTLRLVLVMAVPGWRVPGEVAALAPLPQAMRRASSAASAAWRMWLGRAAAPISSLASRAASGRGPVPRELGQQFLVNSERGCEDVLLGIVLLHERAPARSHTRAERGVVEKPPDRSCERRG